MSIEKIIRVIKTYSSLGAYSQLEFFNFVASQADVNEAELVYKIIPKEHRSAFADWISNYDINYRGTFEIASADAPTPQSDVIEAFKNVIANAKDT